VLPSLRTKALEHSDHSYARFLQIAYRSTIANLYRYCGQYNTSLSEGRTSGLRDKPVKGPTRRLKCHLRSAIPVDRQPLSTNVLPAKPPGMYRAHLNLHQDSDARSCSLACFKQHKAVCNVSPQQQPPPAVPDNTPPTEDARSSIQNPAVNASELQALFTQYPSLRSQLRQIYHSTQEPSEVVNLDRAGHNSRDFSARSWKPEKGFHSGLKFLQAALDRGDTDSEGLDAFMKLLTGQASLNSKAQEPAGIV